MSFIRLTKEQTLSVIHYGPTPSEIQLNSDQVAVVLAEHAGSAAILGTTGPTTPVPKPEPTVWPQYIKVKNGTMIAALAPLNPEYISTQTSWIFGRPPNFVSDPSGGRRSPAGLPITADGKVMMGESTFDNDAAALAWAAANDPNAPATLQQQAAWQDVWARMARPAVAEAAAVDHPAPLTVDPVVTEG